MPPKNTSEPATWSATATAGSQNVLSSEHAGTTSMTSSSTRGGSKKKSKKMSKKDKKKRQEEDLFGMGAQFNSHSRFTRLDYLS
ncbi:hypothetical protein CIB48_g9746 [Xylaria polymorpha]|nr:hypothetical protein CIB48_g9746 [Xylaria polymorpha]